MEAKKEHKWSTRIDRKNYSFTCVREGKEHVVTANGQETRLKTGVLSHFFGYDEVFSYDGRKGRLLLKYIKPRRGRDTSKNILEVPDLVIEGFTLDGGKKYRSRYNVLWLIALTFFVPPLSFFVDGIWFIFAYAAIGIGLSVFRPSSLSKMHYFSLFAGFTFVSFLLLTLIHNLLS